MRWFSVCLLAMLLAGCGARGGAEGAPAGVTGTVVAGPQCPVERAGSPGPDKPVATDLRIEDPTGRVVKMVMSRSDGTFDVLLEPGIYVIDAVHRAGDPFMFGRPTPVTVRPHRITVVTVELDTGIR
jgi:hypothetical protein